MNTIKITTLLPEWPWIRQTPGSKGIWGNAHFFINQEVGVCNWWVVYGGLEKVEEVECPKENTIFITTEPPCIKKYNNQFLSQFGVVITCHQEIEHKNVCFSQQAFPWMVGGNFLGDHFDEKFSKNYDELKIIMKYDKPKQISLILSNKSFTSGHAKRLKFKQKVQKVFGDHLEIFGVGHRELKDKWDGISKYKYHIVLENSSYDDYWTEKLSDSYLGGAYPFYYGCKNILKYFSQEAITIINIDDSDHAIDLIRKEMYSFKFERSFKNILEAKNKILDTYNLFPFMSKFCAKSIFKPIPNRVVLKPEDQFCDTPKKFTKKWFHNFKLF